MNLFKNKDSDNDHKRLSLGDFFHDFRNKTVKFYKKNIIKNRNKFGIKEVVFVMFTTFFFGMIIGGVIMYGKGNFSGSVSSSLNEFVDTYEDILNTYYEEIDSEKLLQSGIEGMIDYLKDPYAAYMNIEETKSFNEQILGEYSGIGAEVVYNNTTGIVSIGEVFKNSPAEDAGLITGDVLIEVNGENVEGKTTTQIASCVKGTKGTKVNLKVRRNDVEKTLTIKREMIDISSVETEIFQKDNQKIGYIAISIFAKNTYEQFNEKLLDLENHDIDSLIIDVRGNSGGYLTTVTSIISLFTKKGSIIYQLSTKGNISKVKDKTNDSRDYPICVIVNGGSASASEVLTSALKENYGAKIIGTRTFGKGKVQKAYSLSTGETIKYTFQEWLTPNGNSIDGKGIEPDDVIEFNTSDNDNQLEEALNEIIK